MRWNCQFWQGGVYQWSYKAYLTLEVGLLHTILTTVLLIASVRYRQQAVMKCSVRTTITAPVLLKTVFSRSYRDRADSTPLVNPDSELSSSGLHKLCWCDSYQNSSWVRNVGKCTKMILIMFYILLVHFYFCITSLSWIVSVKLIDKFNFKNRCELIFHLVKRWKCFDLAMQISGSTTCQ